MKNWIWYIIGIIIIIVLVKQCENKEREKFKSKINKLEKQRDSLRLIQESNILKLDSVSKKIDSIYKSKDSLIMELNDLKQKRNEVPNIVSDYADDELDSILTNYRHPKGN